MIDHHSSSVRRSFNFSGNQNMKISIEYWVSEELINSHVFIRNIKIFTNFPQAGNNGIWSYSSVLIAR